MSDSNSIEIGDCREIMRRWITDGVRVQCCVTSPPYWGLRDYGADGQIGLEATMEEYIATMVEVFRLVREVLADEGTLWLNLGDSYAGSWSGHSMRPMGGTPRPAGLKRKDLIGMPWRVAFALQADGWYLRSDIIWHKPSPLPESVTDRPTRAHEYLFLLSKREKYFYDADAVREPQTGTTHAGRKRTSGPKERLAQEGTRSNSSFHSAIGTHIELLGGRNRRSVWTIATEPYSGAHFATFPRKLVEPCILAGSGPGDVVLDPFMGSGTTGQVAQALGRQWLGCEISDDYKRLVKRRTAQRALSLSEGRI